MSATPGAAMVSVDEHLATVLAAAASLPVRSVAEFVAWVRAREGICRQAAQT